MHFHKKIVIKICYLHFKVGWPMFQIEAIIFLPEIASLHLQPPSMVTASSGCSRRSLGTTSDMWSPGQASLGRGPSLPLLACVSVCLHMCVCVCLCVCARRLCVCVCVCWIYVTQTRGEGGGLGSVGWSRCIYSQSPWFRVGVRLVQVWYRSRFGN